jgi:hypothetical protein
MLIPIRSLARGAHYSLRILPSMRSATQARKSCGPNEELSESQLSQENYVPVCSATSVHFRDGYGR